MIKKREKLNHIGNKDFDHNAKETAQEENQDRSSIDSASELDPFDPARLRLSQDFASNLGVKRVLTTVPVRKPSKESWVRVRPDEDFRLLTGVIELKEEREIYLVAPELWSELSTESTFSPRMLFTTMNRQNVLTLWPIRLPGPDGRIDSWNQSALEAAKLAMESWIRVTANMSLRGYDVYEASADLPEPEWPAMSFRDILEIAFKDRFIKTIDYPVLQRLKGEI